MSLLRHVQAVLWGFIGLGRRGDMAELHRTGSPVVLIVTGIVLVLVFIGALVGLALLAVRFAGSG